MKTRKILSILLTLTMALGLLALMPLTASAAAPSNPSSTGIWDFFDVTANGSGTGWSWVQSSKTLTLTNFNHTTSAEIALMLPGYSTIVLNGTNTITTTRNRNSAGIFAALGTLTIKGTGSLTASATASSDGIGIIVADGLIVSGGTVTAIGGASAIELPRSGYTVPNGCKYWTNTTTADPGGEGIVSDGTTTITSDPSRKFFKVEYISAPRYTVTYYRNGGSGTLPSEPNHAAGETFVAASAPGLSMAGNAFKHWNTRNDGTGTGYAPGATITMPAENLTLYAIWGPAFTVTVNSAGAGATGSGSYAQGASVSISAGAAPSGKVFDKWTASPGVTFADANSANTTFTMPGSNVTVTAEFKNAPEPPDPPKPPRGIFGTNPRYNQWWHYILFFIGFGFIWMWF